ncbi:DNA polymerase type I [gut metagenome]|uniref:DNA-directed DNA polymerase n=1 Tax=gut metagenome TaxID=749906 RepID=J9GN92_9ZZZZ
MKTLYLLDAYALIYRAYYALIRSPRINSKGQNTSAVFGFVNTLEDVLQKEKPDFIGIAFDPAGGTFRHEAYPEYKAQREATPEDIRWAVPIIKDIIRAYRIPILEIPGFEADDVIGTLALKGQEAGLEVHMVTPDKDYAQLVRPGIYMRRPGHGSAEMEKLGVDEICEKYEISSTSQVIDLLGLMGDTADNVPGCPGVGEKTAIKLVKQFGGIDELLAHTDQLKGAQKKKVEENVEQIRFSKFLVTIKTDVPIELNLDELSRREANTEALRPIYEELEFRSFLQKMDKATDPTPQADLFGPLFGSDSGEITSGNNQSTHKTLKEVPHKYILIENQEDAKILCENLLTFQTLSLDTETTSTDAIRARLVGLSFAVEGGEAWYVAVPRETGAAKEWLEIFRPVYESATILKVGQNLKYDLTVLASYGIHLHAPLFDTMLAHYLVQPELRHNMDYLAEIYLNYTPIPIEQLIGPKGRGQKNMADLTPAEICDYACEDADVTLQLYPPLRDELEKNELTRVFNEIEMPLMPVLARMERNGVRLDTEALAETGNQFNQRLEELEREIYELAGHPFLLTSPRQVGEVLFDELKLNEKAKKTKSGQYSTGEEVLEAIRAKHPIVGKILAHRGLKKLVSTYIDALPKLILPETGHIHTSFNQAVTATGRLSSSSPNLQNIPVRGDDGKEIRKAFVAEEGCTFFSADYSQIELRIMAHLSQDEHLIQDFRDGRDIHAATAARIFHKPLEEVTRDERRKAKTANFGIIYGISAFGLAERMEVSRTEAKELIDSYFKTYPKVKEYMEKSVEVARERGYILTEFGRRRYLPDITSRNAVVRGYAERNAVNAPIQGTAADIIKIAMIRIDERLRHEALQTKMILQVHDELNFSVPPTELEHVKQLVVEEMERAFAMSVPLIADCGSGINWLEAH